MNEIKILADMALGIVLQWVMFGPKKVPTFAAWGILCGVATALWIWATPDASKQFSENWRLAILGIVQWIVAAKGAGSTAKAAGMAPATNSL